MKYLLFSLLLCLLACDPVSEVELQPSPPLLGFGDTEGTVAVSGDTLAAHVFWTRATDGARQLPFLVMGADAGGGAVPLDAEGMELLTPSPLAVPAGATEARILLRVRPDFTADLVERRGRLQLLEADWYRLSTRDTFTFGFGVPHTVDLEVFAPPTPFPQIFGYSSGSDAPVPDGGGRDANPHFAFAHASTTLPDVIGFFNEQEARSTNAFNLHRIYAEYDVSSASANIRLPNLLRLIPDAEGAVRGRVEVIPQRITVTRRASSGLPPFTVGISGAGRYDLSTGELMVTVEFDERELGVSAPVVRNYVYRSTPR